MARLLAASVMCGALALPGRAASIESTAVPRSKDDLARESYVEYAWDDKPGPHCPKGHLPVWTMQRCNDSVASMSEDVEYDFKGGYIDPDAEELVATVRPGCTIQNTAEGPRRVYWRSPDPSKFNVVGWRKVKKDLPTDHHRVCYRPTMLAKKTCPYSHEAADHATCGEIARTFEGQATVPKLRGANDATCHVNERFQFKMQEAGGVSDAGTSLVCTLKDIYFGQFHEDCPRGHDLTYEECFALREMTKDETWWETVAMSPEDVKEKCDGMRGCTCRVRPPGAWFMHWGERGDSTPVCRWSKTVSAVEG